jgi:uncharacterized protein DUF4279
MDPLPDGTHAVGAPLRPPSGRPPLRAHRIAGDGANRRLTRPTTRSLAEMPYHPHIQHTFLVRLRQYVYVSLWSDSITPDELTARIGIEPDCVHVRGSRFSGPNPVPRHHMWEVRCDEHNMKLDAQIESVLGRKHDDVSGRLKAGRFFGDDKGDAPILERRADGEIVDTGSILDGE